MKHDRKNAVREEMIADGGSRAGLTEFCNFADATTCLRQEIKKVKKKSRKSNKELIEKMMEKYKDPVQQLEDGDSSCYVATVAMRNVRQQDHQKYDGDGAWSAS